MNLAGSTAYGAQLFRFGRSYGVQFHLEADADLARKWLEMEPYIASLEAARGQGAADSLITDIAQVESSTVALAGQVIKRWLTAVFEQNSTDADAAD